MTAAQRGRIAARVAEVIEGVEGIEVVAQGKHGYFQAKERMRERRGTRVHEIPAWLLSEGTRRIAAIFALLESSPPPSLIVIEEIENGLDPWTLQFVLRALREASADGVQVLFTTHSPYLLDHVEPDEVIHVSRVKGETTYTSVDAYESVKKYLGVVPTGAMYTGGYFTGKQ